MILDWDDAYANRPYIPDGEGYAAQWAAAAADFRSKASNARLDLPYGERARERLDLFYPEGKPKGLLVFVHGGYWMMFDKSVWSHLAAGALANGWAVALPAYPLAPQARIREISVSVAAAIELACQQVAGPLCLAGHSAGGHLVARMACQDSPLPDALRERLQRVMSISGLHDLRSLLRTSMNTTWQMDKEEAVAESPALHEPLERVQVICWAGAIERPEFLRQNDLLVNIWTGLGADIQGYHAPDRHHFDVIAELTQGDSPLVKTLLGLV
ncbi:MAG: alpha/beta hydrolase [Thiolinea sp.]